jgi:hypothetical protein
MQFDRFVITSPYKKLEPTVCAAILLRHFMAVFISQYLMQWLCFCLNNSSWRRVLTKKFEPFEGGQHKTY